MKNSFYFLCVTLVAMGWVTTLEGADLTPAGTVKTSYGTVTIDHLGEKNAAAIGSHVFVGDRVQAGQDSYVGITLRDNTMLTGGPGSTLLINDFKFTADKRDDKLLVSLLKGTFSVVTGLIAKRSPETMEFKTPTMTLGVRGTEFVVEVGGVSE
jgi:hypothetical protein